MRLTYNSSFIKKNQNFTQENNLKIEQTDLKQS